MYRQAVQSENCNVRIQHALVVQRSLSRAVHCCPDTNAQIFSDSPLTLLLIPAEQESLHTAVASPSQQPVAQQQRQQQRRPPPAAGGVLRASKSMSVKRGGGGAKDVDSDAGPARFAQATASEGAGRNRASR